MPKMPKTRKPEVPSDQAPSSMPEPTKAETLSEVRQSALQLVAGLQRLIPSEPVERQHALREYIGLVQDVVHFAECAGPAAVVPASVTQVKAFAALLRTKREEAGFSRPALAKRIGLTDSAIKGLEYGRNAPSRRTMSALLEVPELGLTLADLPGMGSLRGAQDGPAASDDREASAELNFYVPPSFDSVRMVMELGRFLNGAGGHVEQTNAYLDHQSAAAYIAMSSQGQYAAAYRASLPMAAIAKQIAERVGSTGLNVIALGVGDGALEVRLVQCLLDHVESTDIDLCLLDISQPLLSVAHKLAVDTFGEHPSVHVWGMQGSFYQLPLYTHLHYLPPTSRRRRVFAMLGHTLGNLENEPRFFQHNLITCAPGDFLVLDMQLAQAPADRPEQIKAKDKTWATGVPPAHQAWLSGPIKRHCKDVQAIEFSLRLDTQCPVPGSYALDVIATVKSEGRADRQFSIFRFRRYDPTKLEECLSSLGWQRLLAMPFGEPEKTSMVMLFVKTGDGRSE